MMKIGIYTHYLDKYPTSAPSLYQINLIKNLSKLRNIEIILIHHRKSNLEIYKDFNEVVVSKIPYLRENDINSLHLDIIHFNAIPWNWEPFVKRIKCKKISTVHGDIWWVEPQLIDSTYEKITGYLKRLLEPNAAKYLDKIIAVSNSIKNTLIKYLKCPERKIKVIYEGIDHFIFYPRSSEEVEKVKAKYNVNLCILCVSKCMKVKNPNTLFKSFKLVKDTFNNLKLIIVGNNWAKLYKNKLNSYGIQKNDVIFVEWLSQSDLAALYSGAEVFFLPSYHETFGFPNLEAMACGCPVVTSNRYAIPEIVGDAAIMHDPDDYKSFAESIIMILMDEKLRKRLIKKGLERAKEFSWEKTAKQTYELYKEVVDK